MPFSIGEVEVVNEVSLAPSAVLYDGAVVNDGDLTVKVNGFYFDMQGTKGKYAGSCSNPVADNTTNYVYLDNALSLVINTTGYPGFLAHIRLARVVTSGGYVVRIILERALMTAAAPVSGVVGVLEQTFSFSDYPGPVALGTVPAGGNILKTTLEVTTPFNAGVQATIGDAAANARLQAVTDSLLTKARSYQRASGYTYPANTAVNLYFVGSIPTVGAGRVLVYYL